MFQTKVLSWNLRGLGSLTRWMVVKDLRRRHNPLLLTIQESKLKAMSDSVAREVWGSRFVKWLAVDSGGAS